MALESEKDTNTKMTHRQGMFPHTPSWFITSLVDVCLSALSLIQF